MTALAVGLPFALAASVWTGGSVVSLLARTTAHYEATYQWQGGTVSVHTDSGYVQVTGADTNDVVISYTEHYWWHKPKVTTESTAEGGLALSADCGSSLSAQNCATNFVVTVPRGASIDIHAGDGRTTVDAVAGDVQASTGSGSISLSDVGGAVVAKTGDGSIHGEGLTAKQVQARTGSGSISLAWAIAPQHVSTHTGDGSVHLTVPTGSGTYAVAATTGDGSKHIDVATDPAAPHTIAADTGSGSITVAYGP